MSTMELMGERLLADTEGVLGRLAALKHPDLSLPPLDFAPPPAPGGRREDSTAPSLDPFANPDIPSGMPLAGHVTPHGWFGAPRAGHLHAGEDFAAAEGTPVHATAGGTVTWAEVHQGYGLTVQVDHGHGYSTRYAHLSTTFVHRGDHVSRGAVIGAVGHSGNAKGFNHLHYEVRQYGMAEDPAPTLTAKATAPTQVARH